MRKIYRWLEEGGRNHNSSGKKEPSFPCSLLNNNNNNNNNNNDFNYFNHGVNPI